MRGVISTGKTSPRKDSTTGFEHIVASSVSDNRRSDENPNIDGSRRYLLRYGLSWDEEHWKWGPALHSHELMEMKMYRLFCLLTRLNLRGRALKLLKESVLISHEHKINNRFSQPLLTYRSFWSHSSPGEFLWCLIVTSLWSLLFFKVLLH